jgi:hypothetical protein
MLPHVERTNRTLYADGLVLALSVCLALLTWPPEVAAAQGFVSPGPEQELLILGPLSIAAGVIGVTFLTADLHYAFEEHRDLPLGWAIAELCAGGLQLAFGIASFALLDLESSSSGLVVAWGTLGLAVGGWHLGHAIASLVALRDPPTEPSDEAFLAPLITPMAGGGVLGVMGRF